MKTKYSCFKTLLHKELYCSIMLSQPDKNLVKSIQQTLIRHRMHALTEEDVNRIIEMAWEDRTPFEAIKYQFGLPEKEVIQLMRSTLKRSSFNLWRKRVNSGPSQKHAKKQPTAMLRFKCSRQKPISFNKISKR